MSKGRAETDQYTSPTKLGRHRAPDLHTALSHKYRRQYSRPSTQPSLRDCPSRCSHPSQLLSGSSRTRSPSPVVIKPAVACQKSLLLIRARLSSSARLTTLVSYHSRDLGAHGFKHQDRVSRHSPTYSRPPGRVPFSSAPSRQRDWESEDGSLASRVLVECCQLLLSCPLFH